MLGVADILGITAFAISGFIVGVKNRLDILGVSISAFLTALGGGILRDLLAGRKINAFTDSFSVIIVVFVIIAGIFFKLYRYDYEKNNIFLLSDTTGLVSFAISGAVAGVNSGFNLFGVMLLAFITAVGGGMMRDVLINEVPFILKEKFYATVALLTGFLVYVFGIGNVSLFFIFVFGVLLRLFAHKKSWQLPKI